MPKHPTLPVSAFRSADIRGVYPTEINEELVYLIARAFVDEYALETVCLAQDMRLSSPVLAAAFIKGVRDAGATVVDIGLVHTPLLYFVSGSNDMAGVMLTASHSPKDHNGMKLVLGGAIPLTEEFGLKAIRQRMLKGKFEEPKKIGRYIKRDYRAAFQKFILRGVKSGVGSDIKVVADAGNGMGSVLLPLINDHLGWQSEVLFADLDGRFPHHGSDPNLKKNQRHITKQLRQGGYDFGFAFDGDADRVAFFDETGKYINSAAIGALIATQLAKKRKGETFVYTNLTSRAYEETILAVGGKAVPARVGHSYVKEVMREKNAVFGCEHSAHFFYRDFFFTDSVFLTIRYVLEMYVAAKGQGLTFSDLLKPYTQYAQTEDVIVPVSNRPAALAATADMLKAKQPLKVRKFDGYWFDYGEVWGTVKISVTEPALKIMFEGKKRSVAQALQDEVVEFVRNFERAN